MPVSDLAINCWVLGDDYKRVFTVKISRDDNVDGLREAIKTKCQFSHPSNLFILYKVSIPCTPQLAEDAAALDLNALELNPVHKLSQVFANGLPDANIHVVVRIPSEPATARKRPRIDEESVDYEKYVDKTLGTMAPSTVAKTSVVLGVQRDPTDRFVNDRPETDTDQLPIALSYHGFGWFLDVLKGASTDPILKFNRRTFEEKVDEFVRFMNEYYPNEDKRRDRALEYLNNIFLSVLHNCWPLAAAIVFEGKSSDGHASSPTQGIEVILEMKNELAGSGADPIVELCSYYTRALKRESIRPILRSFLFPALGIVVMGPQIGFYALSYGERTRLVTLTPLLPMTAESGNDQVRPVLLNAFEAACLLRHYINEDAKEFMKSVERGTLLNQIKSKFPYVTEVPAHSPSGGASASIIRFQIHDEAFQGRGMRYPNRFLYAATLDNLDNANKKEVVVKFTRRYFPELHTFCTSQGCAPQLLGYGTAPGGWLIVVMERIEHQDTNLQSYAKKHLQKWSEDLRTLVSDFHDMGWVHGDLRDANMVVGNKDPSQVMLVDFDWGGKAGEVYYPTACMHKELETMDASDLRITKERDDLVLSRTLAKLEEQTKTKVI